MKKEINIKIVIDGNKIGTIIQKKGFESNLSSKFEIIGILKKITDDEQMKLNNKLNNEKHASKISIVENLIKIANSLEKMNHTKVSAILDKAIEKLLNCKNC